MKPTIIIINAIFFVCAIVSQTIFSQGDIDHIKNQPYLKDFDKSKCDSTIDNALSGRACQNLAFQRSDSILTVFYNKINKIFETSELKKIKKQKKQFIELQNKWREFRLNHCKIYSAYFSGSSSGNTSASVFMGCLEELTVNRTSEIKSLIQIYTQNPEEK